MHRFSILLVFSLSLLTNVGCGSCSRVLGTQLLPAIAGDVRAQPGAGPVWSLWLLWRADEASLQAMEVCDD